MEDLHLSRLLHLRVPTHLLLEIGKSLADPMMSPWMSIVALIAPGKQPILRQLEDIMTQKMVLTVRGASALLVLVPQLKSTIPAWKIEVERLIHNSLSATCLFPLRFVFLFS